MRKRKFPEGWDESRVRRVIEHYDSQTVEDAVREEQDAFQSTTHTAMDVPVDLVPEVRRLITRKRRVSTK